MLKVAIVLLLRATLVVLISVPFFLVKVQGHGSSVVNSRNVG
ncbi:twin transmembrane helix small protein, partial [Pseudomonas aeruginosa]